MTEDYETRDALFPFRYLGLGLFLAWNWCLNARSNLVWSPALDASSTPPGAVLIVGPSIATIVCLLVLAFSWRHMPDASHCTPLMGASLVLGATGGALRVALGNGLLQGVAMEVACSTAIGISSAVLTLAWAGVYARLETGGVFTFGAGSLVLCGALSLFLGWVEQPVRSLFAVALPVASALLALMSARHIPDHARSDADAVRYRFPWKPVVIMAFAGFIAELVTVALFEQGTLPAILAQAAVGCSVLGVVALTRGRFSPNSLMGASLTALVAALGVLALAGTAGRFAVALLAMVSFVGVKFYAYALLATVAHRHGAPTTWLFGFAAAAVELTSHAGGFIDLFVPGLDSAVGDPLQLAALAVVGLIGLIASAAVWASERSFKSNWAIDAVDVMTGERVRSAQERFVEACERLGAEHGLTEREVEVMMLLAQRQTYQQIAEDLVLSMNTVKSHTHRIYAKLSVHTRDELSAAIEACA